MRIPSGRLALVLLLLASCGRTQQPDRNDDELPGDTDVPGDTDATADTDQPDDDPPVPVIVMSNGFDDSDVGTNSVGAGAGFYGFNVSTFSSRLHMDNADADYASTLVNSLDTFAITDGATWTFTTTLTALDITQDSAMYTDFGIDIGLASARSNRASYNGQRFYNTTGGLFVSLNLERDDVITTSYVVTGDLAINNATKPVDCYGPCAGMESRANYEVVQTPPAPIVVTIVVDAVGWSVTFDGGATLVSGTLDGTWASLGEAALTDEFADGAYLQIFSQNHFAGRGTCDVDDVVVTRTP